MRIGKIFDSLRNKKKQTMSEQTINDELGNQSINSEENIEQTQNTPQEEQQPVNEVEILKEKLEREKEQYLRLFAEFDNYKKRTSRERLDIFKTANKEVITALLPVMDDFERGMTQIEKSEDENLITGVSLIQHKLTDILRNKGLQAIEVKAGDDFNTDFHEAITQIPAPNDDLKGKIVDVVETGYSLNDVVVRYAKVVVGM